MAESRKRETWDLVSPILAELMNGPRSRKDKRPWHASDLNPFSDRRASTVQRVTPREFVESLIHTWL